MELTTYIWNLGIAVTGLLGALEYTIKEARTTDKVEGFVCGLIAFIFGLIGAWNLICLLVKLNVIHP